MCCNTAPSSTFSANHTSRSGMIKTFILANVTDNVFYQLYQSFKCKVDDKYPDKLNILAEDQFQEIK